MYFNMRYAELSYQFTNSYICNVTGVMALSPPPENFNLATFWNNNNYYAAVQ